MAHINNNTYNVTRIPVWAFSRHRDRTASAAQGMATSTATRGDDRETHSLSSPVTYRTERANQNCNSRTSSSTRSPPMQCCISLISSWSSRGGSSASASTDALGV